MVVLKEVNKSDIATIKSWPPYPDEFRELDYALRDNGWLDEFFGEPGSACYAAWDGEDIVGFTILIKTSGADAEFRIAIRSDATGRGLGNEITTQTLKKGFDELGLSQIHLIVRKKHWRAIKLYEKIGFGKSGECVKDINGRTIEFDVMIISKNTFTTITSEAI